MKVGRKKCDSVEYRLRFQAPLRLPEGSGKTSSNFCPPPSCLTYSYACSTPPYASLKKEAKESIETSSNNLSVAICLTYSYAGSHVLHCGTTLGYPQALPLVPSTAAYRRHFLLPILTATQPPRFPSAIWCCTC